jgi:hypothetical protein
MVQNALLSGIKIHKMNRFPKQLFSFVNVRPFRNSIIVTQILTTISKVCVWVSALFFLTFRRLIIHLIWMGFLHNA